MVEYDTERFVPPAPVADVILQNPATGAECAGVSMLIDTGADVTLIPADIAERIGLKIAEGKGYELVGFDGHPQVAAVVHARMVFCGRRFTGQFLVTSEAFGILGRNILNTVSIVVDGPRLAWMEMAAPPVAP